MSAATRPEWILRTWEPADAAEIAARLREPAEHPYLATGEGTSLARGMVPARPVQTIQTSRLAALVEHAAEDLTVTVQAGLRLEALEAALALRNQWLPPASGDRGTVGGLIAADRRNLWSGGHGTIRDYLLGVEFVTGRGERVKAGGRVVKNVAGYDLMKLLTGSLGAFGVVVEATFKVLPRPAVMRTLRHPHEPPGDEGPRLLQVLDRVRPAGLWRRRDADGDAWFIALAGSDTRVAAETERVRAAWGPRTETVEASVPVRTDGDPEGLAVWGGALPGFLAGLDPDVAGPGLAWTADLLGGHLWGTVPRDLSRTDLAEYRRAFQPGEGHLHLDRITGNGLGVWGRDPGEALTLMRAIKRTLDPEGRLVSGRLPGGV